MTDFSPLDSALYESTPEKIAASLRYLRKADAVMAALMPLSASTPTPPAAVPAGYAAALAEVQLATAKFPTWPTDPLHALAVLGEEFGELTKAVLQTVYEPHKVEPDELRTEAIQTAAMALRFLASLEVYRFAQSEQHQQESSRA